MPDSEIKKNMEVHDLIETKKRKSTSLKQLASELKLSTTTVSLVLNAAPSANSIPQETQDRIFDAARRLSYRPNYIARSLRAKRTHTIGVLIPELSGGYSSMVLSGVEKELLDKDFYFLIGSHQHKDEFIERYTRFFMERCVEGILAIDTPQHHQSFLPVVSISGHDKINGVTNIELNHESAATLAVEHLVNLGHRQIAIIKGQDFSSDTEVRANEIVKAAGNCGISIEGSLVSQLVGNDPSPETGYVAAKELLATGSKFTALISFNDMSAIGAIRALKEAGREVPEDVSVIGFDDIYESKYHNPPLTTIRQPLKEMGVLGTKYLLEAIQAPGDEKDSKNVMVEPALVIRQSTALVKR
jgi:DNA-binding LacI/PurR family transcriptional regulator